MTAEEVLSAFRRDAPYLFLGAAFAAVGMVIRLRFLFSTASATRS